MRLRGKVAVVTGASRGIGRAVAQGYAREGAKVAMAARTGSTLEEVAAHIRHSGGEVITFSGDLSREDQVAALMKKANDAFGPVEILVNNAGILIPRAPIHEVTTSDWDLSLAVNLRSVFLCMKTVLPQMIERRCGVVINLSSGAGKRAAPFWGPYAVAKCGIEGLTQLVAEEVRLYGIRVNAVNPGGVRTSMRATAYPDEDPASLPNPEDLAPFFVWLASDHSKGITGESIDWRQWHENKRRIW